MFFELEFGLIGRAVTWFQLKVKRVDKYGRRGGYVIRCRVQVLFVEEVLEVESGNNKEKKQGNGWQRGAKGKREGTLTEVFAKNLLKQRKE